MNNLHIHRVKEVLDFVESTTNRKKIFGFLVTDWFSKRELYGLKRGVIEEKIIKGKLVYGIPDGYDEIKKKTSSDPTVYEFFKEMSDYIENAIISRNHYRVYSKRKQVYPHECKRFRIKLEKLLIDFFSYRFYSRGLKSYQNSPQMKRIKLLIKKVFSNENLKKNLASMYNYKKGFYAFVYDLSEVFIISTQILIAHNLKLIDDPTIHRLATIISEIDKKNKGFITHIEQDLLMALSEPGDFKKYSGTSVVKSIMIANAINPKRKHREEDLVDFFDKR